MALGLMLARFYRSEDEFERLHQRLKLALCPHCRAVGTLILHGKLYGYAEHEDCRKACRGRRIFCNNRKARKNGCGHTFSLRPASTIKRLRASAETLWRFFSLVLSLGNKALALRRAKAELDVSAAYRLWKRLFVGQSQIRSALTQRCAVPDMPHSGREIEQTIAHLKAAFPGKESPITAFQQQLQIDFPLPKHLAT